MRDASAEKPKSLSDWLERLGDRADEMLAEYLAQEPASINLVGKVGSLPGVVFDALVEMKDQLNDDSRAALEEWEEEKYERHRQMFGLPEYENPLYRAIREQEEQRSALYQQWTQVEEYQSALHRQMYEVRENPLHRAMREWQAAEAERNRLIWEAMERAEQAFQQSLPPNWKSPDVEFPDLEDLEVLQLEEGIPLAWVPPNQVLTEVLACRTAAGRRRVIASESAAILKACLKELRRLRSDETREWRSSARQAAAAMEAGHWRAGQALAAIALDTATEKFVRTSYKDATLQSRRGKGAVRVATPPGTSDDSLPTWRDVDYPRALLVLHSLYGAFTEFNPRTGEQVPTQFTRHGTVHTMDRRQYSKANGLIALMHLVGLLCLIEDD